VPPISDKCERLFSSCKILSSNWHSQLQISIIKANKALWHLYRPPLKGIFNNKEVDKLVGEPCEKVPRKEAVKARLTTAEAAA